MSKKDIPEYEPKDVILTARIEPAFRVTIIDDSTGKKWDGHTVYGDTAMGALRRLRTAMLMGDYKRDNLKIRAEEPRLVPAVSWKEEVYE